jgi:hypothetical protein
MTWQWHLIGYQFLLWCNCCLYLLRIIVRGRCVGFGEKSLSSGALPRKGRRTVTGKEKFYVYSLSILTLCSGIYRRIAYSDDVALSFWFNLNRPGTSGDLAWFGSARRELVSLGRRRPSEIDFLIRESRRNRPRKHPNCAVPPCNSNFNGWLFLSRTKGNNDALKWVFWNRRVSRQTHSTIDQK